MSATISLDIEKFVKIGIACLEFTRQKGIGRSVVELTRGITDLGHEVHCHCINWVQPHTSQVHFHRIRTVNLVNTTRLASFAVSGKMSLEGQRYDITHSMGNLIGCNVVTAHSCHKAGLETLGKLPGPADRVRLLIEHQNYAGRRYRHIIAVSKGVKEELMREYGVPTDDISVISNGVNLDEFGPSRRESGLLIRAELGISPDDLVAIFVANEFDRKGLEFVIKAMPRTQLPNFKVIVAGGDDPGKYLKLASDLSMADRIRFVGSVDNIASYYAASDVFVFPSAYEAFSLASLEAAASGLPLLITRINGSEELIEEGVNGFFVEREANSIATRLMEVLSSLEACRRLSENARKSALSYTWENVAQKTLEVYDNVRKLK